MSRSVEDSASPEAELAGEAELLAANALLQHALEELAHAQTLITGRSPKCSRAVAVSITQLETTMLWLEKALEVPL